MQGLLRKLFTTELPCFEYCGRMASTDSETTPRSRLAGHIKARIRSKLAKSARNILRGKTRVFTHKKRGNSGKAP